MRTMRPAQRGGLLATALMVAALGTACGSDDADDVAGTGTTTEETTPMDEPTEDMESEEPSEEPTEEMTADMAGDLVGAGCAGYAEAVPDGAGSVEGMAMDPVATAASNNPLLKTLTAAVSGGVNPEVNLVDTLNGDEFTVFAPVDEAFAKIDAATLATLGTPEGTATLTSILTYHVIPGQLAPDALVGMQTTAQGEVLEVTGEGDAIMINGASAVICGNVKTANATVYLIDTVLMPPSMM